MRSTLRVGVLRGTAMALVTAAVAGGACKRQSSAPAAPAGSTVSGNGTPGGATATGAGALNVTDNVVTYQNVHVELPWKVTDVAEVVRLSQEASAGAGLTLKGANHSLWIASDGRSIRLDGRDGGALKQGDQVVLTNDGILTVNGVPRAAAPGAPKAH